LYHSDKFFSFFFPSICLERLLLFLFFEIITFSFLGLKSLSPQQFVFEKDFQSLLPVAKMVQNKMQIGQAKDKVTK